MDNTNIKRVAFVGLFFILTALFIFEGCGQNVDRGGLMEVKGKLTWVKMTNFPDNPWKELVLVDEGNDQILAILIGTKVEELLEKEGAKIAVKGLPKPEMTVKGEKVTVIEVKEIEYLN
jgi:hypothetical protein